MAKGKYDGTLNLPQTDFPMRANLPKREPEILEFWDEKQIYEKVQEKNQGKEKFILHDGPPYANGNIHLGHTLNKVLKDIIVKFHSMAGFDAPYVWLDIIGLPIENRQLSFGYRPSSTDVYEFRGTAVSIFKNYRDQKERSKRLG